MDFRELSYILAIAKHQNMTKAAESLYVTQPALSKFLVSLEGELGQKLFRKVGRKYVLTYAGERYVSWAKDILRLKTEMDTELDDILSRDMGVLNVAFPPMRCTHMLPGILPAFRALHPNVRVNLFEGTSDENDRRLLNGEVEIAFYSKPNTPNPRFSYQPIGQEELLICVQKGHPVGRWAVPGSDSRYPQLDPALLQHELMLRLMPSQRTRQITDDLFRELNLKYDNEMCISSLHTILELVAVGYGVTLVFENHLNYRHIKNAVDCYSIPDARTVSDFVMARCKDAYLSHYARDFIELTQQCFEQGCASTCP